MSRIALLRAQLKDAHEALELTMQDVDQKLADGTPPGTANRVGERYVHHATSEDSLVHLFLMGAAPPLMSSTWEGRTGASEPRFGTDPEHSRRLTVQLGPARQYQRAVHEATDRYLADLAEADLDRLVDMSSSGFGRVPVWWVVARLIIGHVWEVNGEIAAVKGVLGARGLPF